MTRNSAVAINILHEWGRGTAKQHQLLCTRFTVAHFAARRLLLAKHYDGGCGLSPVSTFHLSGENSHQHFRGAINLTESLMMVMATGTLCRERWAPTNADEVVLVMICMAARTTEEADTTVRLVIPRVMIMMAYSASETVSSGPSQRCDENSQRQCLQMQFFNRTE